MLLEISRESYNSFLRNLENPQERYDPDTPNSFDSAF